jgi:hypothetical protein
MSARDIAANRPLQYRNRKVCKNLRDYPGNTTCGTPYKVTGFGRAEISTAA